MEKEVLVLMLLSVFSLMSLALSPTKNYILERQMLDACGIQATANISRMQWQSSKDHVLRGYDFAYDGLNRLEESTYAEGADMSQNKSSFDNNQNPTFHYYEKDHLGSVRMVVNEKGTIEQVNHYYPFGGVYGDLSYNAEIQKSKYIGKEFDHMYGLDWYDHGARMYDAAGLFWDRKDPLFSKYYSLSPYLYCGNNPVLYLDIDGLDWYQENGLYLYSPDVHSGKDLKKGQIYMGSSFTTGKGSNLATYNNDGSVMFANETQAYNYIWQKANYKKREVGGFLLQNNKVLVLPDYKNDASTTKLNAYEGYSFQGRILSNKLGRYTVKAQIHSHQNRFTSAEPSCYVGNTYGDAGLSKNHFSMPVFVMGHDNVLYLIRGVKSNHVVEVYPLNWGQKSLGKLLKGNIKLSKEIFKLKPIIK